MAPVKSCVREDQISTRAGTQQSLMACLSEGLAIKALSALAVCSLPLVASVRVEANSLQPCGSFRIANTTFCFMDANGDGKYQEGDEEFCLDGWLTRGGLRCRGKGVMAAPAAQPQVVSIRVLTSWNESCSGSMSIDQINQYLRDGYRIVGTNTHTEMQTDSGEPITCTYTTYSLQKS